MRHRKAMDYEFLGKEYRLGDGLAPDVEIDVGRGNLPPRELVTSSKTTPQRPKTPYESPKRKQKKKRKRELYSYADPLLPF